jgi:glycolate oxidase subunit GlcD
MTAWFRKDPFHNLRKALGEGSVMTNPEDLAVYAGDATAFRASPSAVVFAESAPDVQTTVSFARETGLTITPRGAGSGLSGGSVPVDGGIVLSCERMKKIISFNPRERTVLVQPGVVTASLQEMVAKYGLFYPPDPSSHTVSTIGGNVAENAGGLRCFKYGVTGHYVLGLEFVNAAGEVIHTGILRKRPVEPDLTPLLVGSEGTLGVITSAALRLVPLPETTATLAAYYSDAESALRVVEAIISARLVPSVMEFIDRRALAASATHISVSYPEEAGALLLIELDGAADEVAQLREAVDLLAGRNAVEARWAADSEEREKLWSLRRGISPSLIRLSTGKIHEDVAVPRSQLLNLIGCVSEISRQFGVEIPVYGHAGDGNLHTVILYETGNPKSASRAKEAVAAIFHAAIELGGTITGEHGIGCAKREFLPLQRPEPVINLYRKIKAQLDPDGIFNPGKVLT